MSFLDKVKAAFTRTKDKVDDLADEHGDEMKNGVDRTADFVDEKPGGKFSDQIDTAEEKADEVITSMDDTPEPDVEADPNQQG